MCSDSAQRTLKPFDWFAHFWCSIVYCLDGFFSLAATMRYWIEWKMRRKWSIAESYGTFYFGRTIDAIGISKRYQLPPKREHHWIGSEHVAPGILHSIAHEYVENLCVCVCFSLFFGRYIAASHIIVNDTVFQMNYTAGHRCLSTKIHFSNGIGMLPRQFFSIWWHAVN